MKHSDLLVAGYIEWVILSTKNNLSNVSFFKVNGEWGDWSEWDECPVSCGGADQGRTRVCDSPAPQFGGDDCTADGSSDSEIQRCNENPCPSELKSYQLYNIKLSKTVSLS